MTIELVFLLKVSVVAPSEIRFLAVTESVGGYGLDQGFFFLLRGFDGRFEEADRICPSLGRPALGELGQIWTVLGHECEFKRRDFLMIQRVDFEFVFVHIVYERGNKHGIRAEHRIM